MKKVVCFGMCFLIVLCSFVFSFATSQFSDVPQPVIVPQSSDGSSSVRLFGKPSDPDYSYNFYSNNYPVYVVFYASDDSSTFRWLAFSEYPDTSISRYNIGAGTNLSSNLVDEYNGYYFTSGAVNFSSYDVFIPIYNVSVNTSPSDVIDSVSSSVFSTTFDLSYLVDGSVSWLSTMAQAVKNSGLLLFMVLIGMIGIGIGLFRRFTNG